MQSTALAENLMLNISVDIKTYEYTDALVVGDYFYYILNLTNPMPEKISDIFSVSVYKPNGDLIEPAQDYEISIEPSASKEIIAKGGKENETAIFPFDIAGDYKIVVESTKPIELYRWISISYERLNETVIQNSYIRTNEKFSYSFDVMPRWQYGLWKEEEKINKKSLEINQEILTLNTDLDRATKEMLNLTVDLNLATKKMNDATQDIKYATYAMLTVAVLTLIVAFRKN